MFSSTSLLRSQSGWGLLGSSASHIHGGSLWSNSRLRVPGEGRSLNFRVDAAWTRRSKGSEPKKSKKSWGQRSEKFLKPFILDVFISNRFVHAKVMHRVTSRVVAVATSNAKELRLSLPSLIDQNACKVVGEILAERTKEADVYAVVFELRKGDKYEGKVATVVETMKENGIVILD